MPGATPVFGIPYPLMTDPIDDATFAALANAVDVVLAGTKALSDLRTLSPAATAHVGASIALAPATPLTVTWTSKPYDSHGMVGLGTTNITIPVAGVYQFTMESWSLSFATSRTSVDFVIRINGVDQFRERRRASNASSDAVTFIGMYPCAVGDVITVQTQFTGVGNATSVNGNLAVDFVCPLV